MTAEYSLSWENLTNQEVGLRSLLPSLILALSWRHLHGEDPEGVGGRSTQ